MHTATTTLSVSVMRAGLELIALSTLGSAIHAVWAAVLVHGTTSALAVVSMPPTTVMDAVSAMKTGEEMTVASGVRTVVQNVWAAALVPFSTTMTPLSANCSVLSVSPMLIAMTLDTVFVMPAGLVMTVVPGAGSVMTGALMAALDQAHETVLSVSQTLTEMSMASVLVTSTGMDQTVHTTWVPVTSHAPSAKVLYQPTV